LPKSKGFCFESGDLDSENVQPQRGFMVHATADLFLFIATLAILWQQTERATDRCGKRQQGYACKRAKQVDPFYPICAII
jgi:hypothetical protein